MKLRWLSSFLVVSAVALSSKGNPVASAVFNTRTGASGVCLASLQGSPDSYLSRYGVKIRSGSQGQGRAVIPGSGSDPELGQNVARIIQRVETLGGGATFGPLRGLTVWSVPDLNIQARQTGQGLILKSSNNKNVAMIAHELGHQVGNSRGFYGKYNQAVPEKCQMTTYCNASHGFGARNEEFAEVFAAYLTHPNMLKNSSPACRKAYDFIRTQMFGGTEATCTGNPNAPANDDMGGDASEICEDENVASGNLRDLQAASEELEVASHTQEVAQHESSLNGQALAGMAVQFAPVLMNFMQARQQSTQVQNANLPNLMISSPATAASNPFTPTQTPLPVGGGNPFGGQSPSGSVPQPVNAPGEGDQILSNAAEPVTAADSIQTPITTATPPLEQPLPSDSVESQLAPPPGVR